jgi:hypothetical protein
MWIVQSCSRNGSWSTLADRFENEKEALAWALVECRMCSPDMEVRVLTYVVSIYRASSCHYQTNSKHPLLLCQGAGPNPIRLD